MENYSLLVAVIQIFALLAIIVQIRIAIVTMKADHERRKKEATIEHFGHIWRDIRHKLESRYGTDPITKEDLDKIHENKQLNADIIQLLGALEHMAVGVNIGVYDREVLYRMSASSIINIYHRLKLFIDARQVKNPNIYIEFQELATEFADRKRVKPKNIGKIELS